MEFKAFKHFTPVGIHLNLIISWYIFLLREYSLRNIEVHVSRVEICHTSVKVGYKNFSNMYMYHWQKKRVILNVVMVLLHIYEIIIV